MKTVAGFSLLLFVAIPIAAQVPYIESVEVRVHNVDVVVTDAKGNPVRGLSRADFEVLEDGKPQPITNFSAYDDGTAPPASSAAEPGVPEAAQTAKAAPRKFIFYVDEMALTQPAAKKLEAELRRLLRDTMRDGDEAMVVRPAQEEKLKLPFTGNRAAVETALVEAIDAERWRATSPIFLEQRQLEIEMRGASSGLARRAAARRWATWVRSRVQERFGQLRAIVTAAAEVPGRKVLVLVAESMPLEPGKEAFTATTGAVSEMAFEDRAEQTPFGDWSLITEFGSVDWVNLTPLVEEIARNAATNGITIYALQPEYGIGMLAPDGAIDGPTPGREAWGIPGGTQTVRRASTPIAGTSGNSMMVEQRATNTEGTLSRLAAITGGTWHRGGLSFDDLVDEIAADVASYYSLGYHAGSDYDTPHRIEVRVKNHPDLRVRTRQEVIRRSPEREMSERVVASLVAPIGANEIPLALDSKIGPGAGVASRTLSVEVRVPLASLAFLPDGDNLKARFSVHYALTGKDSDFVSGIHGTQDVVIPSAAFEKARSKYWTYVLPLNVAKAKYTVAVGVLDGISRESGFAKLNVDLK